MIVLNLTLNGWPGKMLKNCEILEWKRECFVSIGIVWSHKSGEKWLYKVL